MDRGAADGSSLLGIARDPTIKAEQSDASLLLVFDQAEELLGAGDATRTDAFLRLIRAVLEQSQGHLIALATMRSEFLGAFQTPPLKIGGQPILGPGLREQHDVEIPDYPKRWRDGAILQREGRWLALRKGRDLFLLSPTEPDDEPLAALKRCRGGTPGAWRRVAQGGIRVGPLSSVYREVRRVPVKARCSILRRSNPTTLQSHPGTPL